MTSTSELATGRDFRVYAQEMNASLPQKLLDILPWVRPGRIVDKGCGTGRMALALAAIFVDSEIVGIDCSQELIERRGPMVVNAKFHLNNLAVWTAEPNSCDTVIYSSVLHELRSYGGSDLLDTSLARTFTELRPGGRVIIRDGIAPPPAKWLLTCLTGKVARQLHRFTAEFDHGRGAEYSVRGSKHTYELQSADAAEFLAKKDYETNWHIEVNERFCLYDKPRWHKVLGSHGFEVEHFAEYVNPWIAVNRYHGYVQLRDLNWKPLPYPSTNCVLVGRKPA